MEARDTVKRLPFIAMLIALFGLASCHGTAAPSTAVTCTTTTAGTSSSASSSTCTDPTTGITITISPVTVSVNVVTNQQFFASVSGGTNNVITWQVDGVTGGNDTTGRIDSNGLYHAPSAVPSKTTVTVAAVAYEEPALSAPATVTILPAPTVTLTSPASLVVSSGTANTLTFSATVTGAATTNVDWLVNNILGGNAAFGTINSNGVYTAPLTPPIGSTVTVTAASNDFPTATSSATVTVSGYSTSSFQGQFAFSMSGRSAAGAFFRAGSFSADGNGSLFGGQEDINDSLGPTSSPISFVGSYTIGVDGRGTLTFNDNRATTPALFDFVLVNSTQLQIIGFDASGTSIGQADLRDASTFGMSGLRGTYVFDFSGMHGSNTLSQIGEFTADGAGGITGGLMDANDGGTLTPQSSFTGSYQVTSGRGTATLATSGATLHFSFYIVSRGAAKFVGTDAAQQVAGATSQQVPNVAFDKASLNGNYAFLLAGPGSGGTFAAAGSFLADGNLNLTSGVFDENVNGAPNANVAFSGSYTVASNGRGTAAFTGGRTYVFYLGPAGSAVFQETDSIHPGVVVDGFFSQQQGVAFSLASIQGNYAVTSSGLSGALSEVFLGQLKADGLGTVPSGITPPNAIDINDAGTLTTGEAITGTYATSSSSERGTLTLNPSSDNRNFAVYVVSGTQAILLGTDTGRLAAGALFKRF